MKRYIAIVKTVDNRVGKYKDFDTQVEANSHVSTHGGVVYDNQSGNPLSELYIDSGEVSVVSTFNLNVYKALKIQKNREEAESRIRTALSLPSDFKRMIFKEMNMMMQYLELREAEEAGTITSPQQTVLDALRSAKNTVKSIRQAENTAATSINNASDKAGVDSVTVSWP